MSQNKRVIKWEKDWSFRMDSDRLSVEEMIAYYKPELEKLAVYIPWLKAQKGKKSATTFKGEGVDKNSITFPVYDSTLLAFVKAAQASKLIDRNYVYFYSRTKIRTQKQEWSYIQNATIREMGDLWQIFSKYILKGMTKAGLWSEAVENGIFLELLLKMKDIIAFWGKQRREDERQR